MAFAFFYPPPAGDWRLWFRGRNNGAPLSLTIRPVWSISISIFSWKRGGWQLF